MLFRPTEKSTPSATATIGEPKGAKMSTPWCQATVARAAPHVSVKDVRPITGNTYGPPVSFGVPYCGGPAIRVPPPKIAPLFQVAAGVAVAGSGLSSPFGAA